MEILYLLIPLSAVLVLGILGVFAWALNGGQFDDLEQQAGQILAAEGSAVDPRQYADSAGRKNHGVDFEVKDEEAHEREPAR
jgi:cbb3-type cytochrome oxidase maturation protein